MPSTLDPLQFLINIADPNKAGNLQSFNSTSVNPTALYFREDGDPIQISVVTPNVTGARPWDYVDISNALIELAIDNADLTPTAGSWEISDGTNNSTLLPYNVTASALQTAINALALVSIPTTVTLISTGVYLVTGTTNGTIVPLVGLAESLYPQSGVGIIQLQTGSASQPSVQLIQLQLNPATYQEITTALPTAAGTVTTLAAGGSGVPAIFLLTLNPQPYDGTFTLTDSDGTTGAIPWNANAATVQAALVAVTGNTEWVVTGNPAGPWTITNNSGTAVGAPTVNVTGLIIPTGFTGTLQLATPGIIERFIAATTANLTLTLQIRITYPGQQPVIILSVPVNIARDIIRSAQFYTPAYPTSYTTAQTDAIIAALGGYGSATASSSGTTSISIPSKCKIFTERLTVGAGSGTYTAIIDLPDSGRVAGDKCAITLLMPASTNPTIQIQDGATSTLLWTESGTGSIYSHLLWFTYSGAAWIGDQ